MKKQVFQIVIVVILGVMAIMPFVAPVNPPKVKAAGYSTLEIPATNQYWAWTDYTSWNNAVTNWPAGSSGDGVNVAYYCGSDTNEWRIQATALQFDVSSISGDLEIIDVELVMTVSAKSVVGSPTFSAPYISIYDHSSLTMNGQWYSLFGEGHGRVSSVKSWSDIPSSGNVSFPISSDDWDTVLTADTGDNSFLALVTEQHAMKFVPGEWQAGYQYYALGVQKTPAPPTLVITYTAEAAEREVQLEDNAAVDADVLGNEVADNVTCTTLRLMYADEDLQFDVSGNSGAQISLNLVDINGSVLESHDDSVRVNEHYYWQINTLSLGYQGFVRVRELNNNLTSPWVRVEPAPDSSQSNLKTYARSTEYTQYTRPFSYYVVDRGDLMTVHWKTNIDPSTEAADYSLELYSNGDNATPAYSSTLAEMIAEYYLGSDDNQDALLHWRYALFTPKLSLGQDDRGGLINDLGLDMTAENRGFIQPVILDNTDNSQLTETHSAYWYLESAADGISVSLIDDNIQPGVEPEISVTVGRPCNADRYLYQLAAEVVGYGTTVYTEVDIGENTVALDALSSEGDYTVRIYLYDDVDHTYVYVRDLSLAVSGTGIDPDEGTGDDWTQPENIIQMIQRWLNLNDLLDEQTRHILVFLGMIVLCVFFWPDRYARVWAPLGLLGLALIAGWVNQWLIILLALGAGFTIWGLFRRHGRGGENEDGY